MKKLLSIVICVLLGVTTLWAANGTTTIKAYAMYDPDEDGILVAGGGTVKALASTAGRWSEGTLTEGTTSTDGTYSTATGTGYDGSIFKNGYNVQFSVVSTLTGYYFSGWYDGTTSSATLISNLSDYKIHYGSNQNGGTITLYAIFKKQSIHRDYAKVVAIYVNEEGIPVFTWDGSDHSTIVLEQGGGYVNIGAVATNQTEVEYGDYNTLAYRDASEHSWNYTYYATPAENYAFASWYDEPTMQQQLQQHGKLLLDQSTDAEYLKTFTSNCTDATSADIPVAPTMYAVFRPSLTYHYSGPSVYVSNNEPEGGVVYVHSTNAADKPASINAVAAANWKTSHDDNANTYTQKDNPTYTYTYYAKPSDPAKYAFKGWATSQFSDPTYGTDPISPMYDYTQTMSAENTKPENRYITPPLFAVFESFYYKAPPAALATASKGAGYVYVDLTGTGMPTGYTGTEVIAGALNQVAANGVQHNYAVHYYATPIPGNVFVGWSTTADGLNIVNQNAHYQTEYASQAKNRDYPHVAAPLYAVFRSDIDIRQQDRMIVYIDEEGNGNINDSKVLIDFQKANTLTATLSGTDASLFSLSNRSGSKSGSSITFDATQGLIELVVTYKGDLATAVGKVANITLSATYGGQTITRPVTIVVEEAPIITFLPTDGKGTYTIRMTNGSGINYTMDAATKENIKVPITHESMSNIEMALTNDVSSDNYYFFGWQMIDGNDMTYISYEQLCTYQFTKPVKVRAEFIPKNRATYYIKNDPTNTLYHDLQKALDDANVLYNKNQVAQTVVLKDYQGATRVTEATLPKGTYTIYKGITLLIPGDAVHTSKDELEPADYDDGKKTAQPYMKWIVEDGTNFTVRGNLSIYSRLNAHGQTWVGRPWQYGWIELGENCKMTFESGANLYAFGYITGPLSSTITMQSGSQVKEAFQILDWHGGTETLEYLNLLGALNGGNYAKSEKVFPSSQFYIQNVEVPMTLEYGAEERLSAGVSMGDLTVIEAPFIAANDGVFRLVDGVSVTKHYDKYTDSQVYTINGNGTSEAKLGNIVLDVNVSILNAKLNSAHFVLPMPHNMDIRVKNTKLNIMYDMAFLAGSKVSVDKTSHVIINGTSSQTARVFLYDRSENGPYFSLSNAEFVTVGARPGGMVFERKPEDLKDASFIVDGVIETGQYGYLYTTASGADITSNGGGKMKYAKIDTGTKNTYQRPYLQGFIPIPVEPANMHNLDNTYVSAEVGTFTYRQGQWRKEDVAVTPTPAPVVNYIPTFNADNKTLTAFVGKDDTKAVGITTNNNNVTWGDVNWSYVLTGSNADQFKLTGTLPNANIVFTPTSEGVKTATLKITAKYDYTVFGQTLTYVYSKDIYLTGNASYLAANTLAFADWSTLYEGQSGVALFTTGNNTQPITITANPASAVTITGNTAAATIAGNTIGKVTITATQPDDLTNNIAGTTLTKTVKVTDAVEWNWGDLYFGTVNTNPVKIHNGATTWTLVEKEDKKNIINLQGTSPNYTASIEDQIAGKYTVTFTYSDNKGVTKDFVSTIYTNPRHLRVDVNNDTVYRAVTLSANMQVNYHSNRKAVGFSSTAQNISQWKMTFLGVPDKIYFTPEGNNTWQIEESSNGTNWTTSMPWKYLTTNQPFEMSLLPSTSYLRVSYGAGDLDSAYLKELYITELADIKADVKKIYMPIDGENNAVKEVVLTYANTGRLDIRTSDASKFKVKFSDSNAAPNDVLSIPATTEDNPFGIKGVEVVCYAAEETTGELQVYNGSQLVLQIPIYAYLFPQELPIKLATDRPAGGDRYYFVTTHSHNTEWDGTDGVRTITMNNAVSDAAPYVTFAFDGNPTFISFDYTSEAKGTWVIEQSTDGKNWNTTIPAADDVMASGKLHRTVATTSKYLRVIYESAYAEKIDIRNLTIVGGASVVVDPTKMELDYNVAEQLTITAINLTAINLATSSSNFTITPTTTNAYAQTLSLNTTTNPDQLGENKMGDIVLDVKWTGNQMVEYGTLTITNPNDANAVLATVELIGVKNSITDGNINIKTGVPSGYTLKGTFEGTEHRPVDISAAFSTAKKPLFDYVVVYGETTTNDGQPVISTPNKNAGSNAKTPYYIYKKSNDGNSYQLHQVVENANSSTKAWFENGDDAVTPNGQTSVSMYITGFCPYATTGYTKDDEGVWYFRANSGQSIDVYLQDCYLYSRAKTIDGHTFADRSDGHSFTDRYSRGTGAVLVFACNEKDNVNPMNVTIHTLDNNLLKSNYGCFLQSIAGRAFQASSPIQIRLIEDNYATATTTTLNFTDEWPASQHPKTGSGVRTNGFISLQKQVNNAPSIDMGNSKTVVNFNGGQVELQNAQIVSTNYASSLAICPRSGKFAGIFLAYGLGTDDVGGTVNFNDGTTTVQPMWVSPTYFESYLCEKDANGNYITNAKGEYLTTCLRTPTNTFVYGGSHCMMRACSDPQSQGGAPKDKPGNDGKLLGLYKYPKNPESGKKGGWTDNGTNGLVTPTTGNVPAGYQVNSVTPNNNGTDDLADDYLNFWFDPIFEPEAQPEIDKKISYWKTCMTRIEAEYAGEGGSVGGDALVEFADAVQTEIVKNLLYCKIDENILNVIQDENYYAPVKNPAPEGGNYLPVHPSFVGDEQQHDITNSQTYRVENKIYYITTATADTWNAFTAPFDVAKVYVMETYPEAELVKMDTRAAILQEQAKHNADFASFFGVTIALGQNKSFDVIYNEYIQWAKLQDKEAGLYTSGAYDLRGKYELIPYTPGNWKTANCYISENNGVWNITGEDQYATLETTWKYVDASDGILMHKGKTYSMLLPYCAGCGEKDSEGNVVSREMWDYWSGKFLIFESTDTPDGGHKVNGKEYFDNLLVTPAAGTAIMRGNATFASMPTEDKDIYVYYPDLNGSSFLINEDDGTGDWLPVLPSESFMILNVTSPSVETYIKGVKSTGELIYANRDNTTTGVGNTPTIGGNSSLFITAISDGINVAVDAPQYVRVLTASGHIVYAGFVQDNVNVILPVNGIYIVSGEKEAQKIMLNL
ncbi:MAG: hypothetical protein J6R26_04130 [Paludibacteraceae bacterium]|nr:hypothetical protein [Paludibacteraceae bacterium]